MQVGSIRTAGLRTTFGHRVHIISRYRLHVCYLQLPILSRRLFTHTWLEWPSRQLLPETLTIYPHLTRMTVSSITHTWLFTHTYLLAGNSWKNFFAWYGLVYFLWFVHAFGPLINVWLWRFQMMHVAKSFGLYRRQNRAWVEDLEKRAASMSSKTVAKSTTQILGNPLYTSIDYMKSTTSSCSTKLGKTHIFNIINFKWYRSLELLAAQVL
jgi:hypothetical protein